MSTNYPKDPMDYLVYFFGLTFFGTFFSVGSIMVNIVKIKNNEKLRGGIGLAVSIIAFILFFAYFFYRFAQNVFYSGRTL